MTLRNCATRLRQAKLHDTEQPGRQHGVKNRARHEIVVLAQQPQIIIRAVQDEFVFAEGLEQWSEVEVGERINQLVRVRDADLHEADLFRIRVQAVGLGVQGNPGRGAQTRQQAA